MQICKIIYTVLIFFVYPNPSGERRTDDPEEIGRGARRSQNQFTLRQLAEWGE
jgi:hypothetical protein